ncbi:MAG TPA: hypothetical protein DCP25_13080 [Chloroflexi bacterium]|nr:hypothetical protein [Chloroflexota bacterium]
MKFPPRDSIHFNPGDPLSEGDSTYRITTRDGLLSGRGEAEPLGAGGSGVVYRARQKERMQRAIKLTCPRDELRERQDSDQFAATWEAEVAVLAEVTHTRIAKIIDWGEALHPQGILPYTVMEYIEGVHMDEMWVRESVTGATFLALFDHVFDALDYLHGEGIMHCDVKAANVLVRRDSRGYSATLVDLGVAKVLKPFAEEEDEDGVSETPSLSAGAEAMPVSDELSDVTMFFSTARITRPEWQGLIEQQVPRAQIAEMFPGHDLYAFGKLLEQALESSNVAVAIERDLGKQASTRGGRDDPRSAVGPAWRGVLPDRQLCPTGLGEAQPGLSIAAADPGACGWRKCSNVSGHARGPRQHHRPCLRHHQPPALSAAEKHPAARACVSGLSGRFAFASPPLSLNLRHYASLRQPSPERSQLPPTR